ncbi:MAG: UDP-N-acetylglucosamine--N-acetylmuramyl-(pentapeptide) pyrophosphoryl-undecaprenol N-acetylglucosamine transferase [bacterium]
MYKQKPRTLKLVVTGGHLTPALATINAILRLKPEAKVFFFGRKNSREGDTASSAEFDVISNLGIPFIQIITGRLQRKFTRYTLPSLAKIPIGVVQCLRNLIQIRPDIIVSFGGYVAVPVALAGWILRIPIVTHEQTLTIGLANKIISLVSNVVATTYNANGETRHASKTVVTGNPTIKHKHEQITNNPLHGKLNSRLPTILITGGNQGSHAINSVVFESIDKLLTIANVIHQTGNSEVTMDYDTGLHIKQTLPIEQSHRYMIYDYINPNLMGMFYDKAELVISRAGANTITELLVYGKKAVLIPLNNEQRTNAKHYTQFNLGTIIDQENLATETLIAIVKQWLETKPPQRDISRALSTVGKNKDAANTLAKLILKTTKTSFTLEKTNN